MAQIGKQKQLTAASRAKINELIRRGVPLDEAMKTAELEVVEWAAPVYGGDAYRDAFRTALEEQLIPLLHAGGFEGTGLTQHRTVGEVIQVVGVQDNRARDSCAVNLEIQLRFLPANCVFRRRLAVDGEFDRWWSYGRTDAEAVANAGELVALFRERGVPYVATWARFPDAFLDVTAEQIVALADHLEQIRAANVATATSPTLPLPAFLQPAEAACVVARILIHVNQPERARTFATLGLELARRFAEAKPEREAAEILQTLG